ncbi:hypothetical protein Misp01_20420 [Microtetraspora sp. NBRC 13810]|uniref:GNAT family N-acetyltransferase n=1 Tax=Microtetraspora sp. NBRC 13810 TaxID=3030990 RepID=UPI0024A336AE|nr:GNAT family N-acetyltransferase [Microtetraspora sp. NBRC 13810]GLW06912.1 hypothetical protein Misp01_20420 [Microtetraspora sp. NBRC 13810]
MIGEFASAVELAAACGGDDLLMWGAQDLRGRARAWWLGEAVAVACPGLYLRDRLVVSGPVADAERLVKHGLAECGPSFGVYGDAGLVAGLSELCGGRVTAFSWMSAAAAPRPAGPGPGVPAWLEERAGGEVAALLAAHHPASYAVPGGVGVRRWAGVRLDGELAAVAADAWSTSGVGFLAGVATAAAWRGRGLAERVCRFVTRELVAGHGRAALMVDDDNVAAIGVYVRLGFGRRAVAVVRPV